RLADRVHQLAQDALAAVGLDGVPDRILCQRPALGVADHLAAGIFEQRRRRVQDRVHDEDAGAGLVAHGFRPSSPAIGTSASRTSSTCSSNGTPSSSAALTSSSRRTARANALSFIFLRTVRASTEDSERSGLT